jgi:hypothetical protein
MAEAVMATIGVPWILGLLLNSLALRMKYVEAYPSIYV